MTAIQNLDSLIIEKLTNYGKPMLFCQVYDGLVANEAHAIEEDLSSVGKWKPAYKIVSSRLQALRTANKIKYNPRWNRGWKVVQ